MTSRVLVAAAFALTMLSASAAQAELRHAEIKTLGMD
jgi:hypothetical protein